MARVHITGVSDTICLQIPEWIHWVYTKFHEMNVCFRFIKQVKLSEHIVVLEKEGICKKHPLSDSTNINKICFLFGPNFACYVVHNKNNRGRFWKYLKTIYGPTSFAENENDSRDAADAAFHNEKRLSKSLTPPNRLKKPKRSPKVKNNWIFFCLIFITQSKMQNC